MTGSPEEMEHEVEATRARLDRTLDTLQARLTLSGLAEDLIGTQAPAQAAGVTARRLLQTIRENGVPAALIGAGLGYLLYDAVRQEAERRRLRVVRAGSASGTPEPGRGA